MSTPITTTPPPLLDDQVGRIDAAIADAEKNTSGELIAVVAGRSSIYWHAPYEAGLWFAGIAILGVTVGSLISGNGWPHWHIGYYAAITVAAFLTGFFASRVDRIERFFADHDIMRAECEERAKSLFTEYGLFRTVGRTGVLLYVSLFEHMVIVLGDSSISAKLGPEAYAQIVERVVKSIRAGNLERGLIDGIEMLGVQLAGYFPRGDGDTNELPDKLYILP
jgi:putative membrane protein